MISTTNIFDSGMGRSTSEETPIINYPVNNSNARKGVLSVKARVTRKEKIALKKKKELAVETNKLKQSVPKLSRQSAEANIFDHQAFKQLIEAECKRDEEIIKAECGETKPKNGSRKKGINSFTALCSSKIPSISRRKLKIHTRIDPFNDGAVVYSNRAHNSVSTHSRNFSKMSKFNSKTINEDIWKKVPKIKTKKISFDPLKDLSRKEKKIFKEKEYQVIANSVHISYPKYDESDWLEPDNKPINIFKNANPKYIKKQTLNRIEILNRRASPNHSAYIEKLKYDCPITNHWFHKKTVEIAPCVSIRAEVGNEDDPDFNNQNIVRDNFEELISDREYQPPERVFASDLENNEVSEFYGSYEPISLNQGFENNLLGYFHDLSNNEMTIVQAATEARMFLNILRNRSFSTSMHNIRLLITLAALDRTDANLVMSQSGNDREEYVLKSMSGYIASTKSIEAWSTRARTLILNLGKNFDTLTVTTQNYLNSFANLQFEHIKHQVLDVQTANVNVDVPPRISNQISAALDQAARMFSNVEDAVRSIPNRVTIDHNIPFLSSLFSNGVFTEGQIKFAAVLLCVSIASLIPFIKERYIIKSFLIGIQAGITYTYSNDPVVSVINVISLSLPVLIEHYKNIESKVDTSEVPLDPTTIDAELGVDDITNVAYTVNTAIMSYIYACVFRDASKGGVQKGVLRFFKDASDLPKISSSLSFHFDFFLTHITNFINWLSKLVSGEAIINLNERYPEYCGLLDRFNKVANCLTLDVKNFNKTNLTTLVAIRGELQHLLKRIPINFENKQYRDTVILLENRCNAICKVFETKHLNPKGNRIRAMFILITGPPGVGKSTIMPRIQHHIASTCFSAPDYEHYVNNLEDAVYNYQFEDPRWDGYKGQLMMSIDDWGQLKDQGAETLNQFWTVIRVVNTAPFVTLQADLIDKGAWPCNVRLLIANSNMKTLNIPSFEDPESVERRPDLAVMQVPKEAYAKKGYDVADPWTRRLDKAKAKFERVFDHAQGKYISLPSSDVMEFYPYNIKTGAINGVSLSAELLYIQSERIYKQIEKEGEDTLNGNRLLLNQHHNKRKHSEKFSCVLKELPKCVDFRRAEMVSMINPKPIPRYKYIVHGIDDVRHINSEVGNPSVAEGIRQARVARLEQDQAQRARNAINGVSNNEWDDSLPVSERSIFSESDFDELSEPVVIPEVLGAQDTYFRFVRERETFCTRIFRSIDNYFRGINDQTQIEIMKARAWAEMRSAKAQGFLKTCILKFSLVPQLAAITFESYKNEAHWVMSNFYRAYVKKWILPTVIETNRTTDSLLNYKNGLVFLGSISAIAAVGLLAWTFIKPSVLSESGNDKIKKVKKSNHKAAIKMRRLDSKIAQIHEAFPVNSESGIKFSNDSLGVFNFFSNRVMYNVHLGNPDSPLFTISFIQSRTAFVEKHCYSFLEEKFLKGGDFTVYFEKCGIQTRKTIPVKWTKCAGQLWWDPKFLNEDLAAWVFPPTCGIQPHTTSLVHYIDENHVALKRSFYAGSLYYRDGHYTPLPVHISPTVGTFVYDDLPDYKPAFGYCGKVATSGGDCGAGTFIIDEVSDKTYLFGLHCGSASGTARYLPVTRQMAEVAISFEEDPVIIIKEEFGKDYQDPHTTDLSHILPPQMEPVAIVPMMEGSFINSIKPSIFIDKQTKEGPWGLPERVPGNPRKRPVDTGEVDEFGIPLYVERDPEYMARAKYAPSLPEIDPDIAKECAKSYAYRINNLCKPPDPERAFQFTYEQAVLGHGNLPSIAMNTSSGYMTKSKKEIFPNVDGNIQLDSELSQELKKDCLEEIEMLKNGIFPDWIFKDFSKNETLPRAKVKKGKMRMVAGSQLRLVVVCRMLFGPLLDYLADNISVSGVAVGINPHGIDWQILVDLISGVNINNVIAGDHGNWDGKVRALLLLMANLVSDNIFYVGGPIDLQKARRTLVEAFGNSRHVVNDPEYKRAIIYVMLGGLPSGHPLTAVFNSFVNNIITRYVMIVAVRENFPNTSVSEIECEFYINTFGDDIIMSISDDLIFMGVTQSSLTREFAKLGMDFTDEAKGDKQHEVRHLYSCTFLQRGFRYEPVAGRTVAPLNFPSIKNPIEWVEKKATMSEFARNCQIAVFEMAVRGKDTFPMETKPLLEHCLVHGIMPPITEWRESLDEALNLKMQHL